MGSTGSWRGSRCAGTGQMLWLRVGDTSGSGKPGSAWRRPWGTLACLSAQSLQRTDLSAPTLREPAPGSGLESVSRRVRSPSSAASPPACLINLGCDCTVSGAFGVASRITDLATMLISNKDPQPLPQNVTFDFGAK